MTQFSRRAVLTFLVGLSILNVRCTKNTSDVTAAPAAAAVESFDVKGEDLIVGVKEGQIYALLNLFPNAGAIKSMSSADALGAITRTAQKYLSVESQKDRFRTFTDGKVDVVFITKHDEYGRQDMNSVVPLGWLKLKKNAQGSMVTAESQLDLKACCSGK